MKVSEMISKLQDILKEHGDLDIVQYNDEFGRCYATDSNPDFLKVVKKDWQPDRDDPEYDEDKWRYIEFPMCTKELYDKCTDEVVIL